MCGRFAQVFDDQGLDRVETILRAMIRVGSDPFRGSYNVAPTQAAVVVEGGEGPGERPRRGSGARFGLVPSWSKGSEDGPLMFNARSETIREKASFRNLVRSRRCVVPVLGFYEWQGVVGEKRKRPWFLSRADGDPMMLGGVCDTWVGSDGSELDSFAIITKRPDSFVGTVHDRMPLILEREAIELWFDREAPDREIDVLLNADPVEGVVSGIRVGSRVSSVVHDDPGLIEESVEGDQGMLFG